jgi:Tol biopolymer transport system component
MSDDGKTLAFGDGGRKSGDGKVFGYIRQTDGSPAVLLSEAGNPLAFSPDGQWVLTMAPGAAQMTLVPTRAGDSRLLDAGRIVRFNGLTSGTRWLADGRTIVFIANEADRPRRVFIQRLGGGPPEALSPEGVDGPLVVSPDSTVVVARDPQGQLSKYPVKGGTSTVLAGAVRGDQPLAWSADGEAIWVLSRATPPARIFRIELRTGRRVLWREVPYSDPAAIEFDQLRVVMSADGSKFVYSYQTHLSQIYLAKGLR